MKPRDIFGIAVRLLGLVFLARGLILVPEAADSLFRSLVHFDPYQIFSGLWLAGWPLLAAWWLVRGAPPLMRIAYPEAKDTEGSAAVDAEKRKQNKPPPH
jgi:hypothetical protein